jgi:hypothetical protein
MVACVRLCVNELFGVIDVVRLSFDWVSTTPPPEASAKPVSRVAAGWKTMA